LDQHRIAGLGNMLVDEVLWRSALAPDRPAGSLSADEVTRLHRTIRRRLPVMMAAGGSHTGTISSSFRTHGGPCPRCGAEMRRATIGTRTTWWCPVHQV
jgi:formamidopyrimidine-DNA glycosylase